MDKIYDEYYEKIYNWSLKKTNNKFDAEDLTNSVFVAVFEYFNQNIKVEKLNNLIWKIASNLWYKKTLEYVKEKENLYYDLQDYGCNVNMLDKIIYKEIIDDIDKINLKEKEILSFKMYYIDDLSVKEISAKLNSTESNVKYYLYSARNKIKERYYG